MYFLIVLWRLSSIHNKSQDVDLFLNGNLVKNNQHTSCQDGKHVGSFKEHFGRHEMSWFQLNLSLFVTKATADRVMIQDS